MKKGIFKIGLVTFLSILLFSACNSEPPKDEGVEKVIESVEYYCPNGCEGDKVYHEPGNCPVCGNALSQRVIKRVDMSTPQT